MPIAIGKKPPNAAMGIARQAPTKKQPHQGRLLKGRYGFLLST